MVVTEPGVHDSLSGTSAGEPRSPSPREVSAGGTAQGDRFTRIARVALMMLLVGVGVSRAIAAAVPQDAPAKTPPPPPAEPKDKPETSDDQTQEASPERKSADEVLEDILRRRPQKRLVPPVGQAEQPDNGAAAWHEGWQIVSRAGRLVPDGDNWIFVFESDSPENPEPRLRLLPNLKLEAMVRETTAAGASPVYIVSGEVTVYFGENYLLTRLALRKPNASNLSK